MGRWVRGYSGDSTDTFFTRRLNQHPIFWMLIFVSRRVSCQGTRICSVQGHQRVKPSQASDRNRRTPLKESRKDRCDKKKPVRFARKPPSKLRNRIPRIGSRVVRFKKAQHIIISSAIRDFNPARRKVRLNNRHPSDSGVPESKASPQNFNVSRDASPIAESS